MSATWAGAVFLIGCAVGVWIGRAWQARQPISSNVTVRRKDLPNLSLQLNFTRWVDVAEQAGQAELVGKLEQAQHQGFCWTHRTIVIGDGGVEA